MAKTRMPMSREARAAYREIERGVDRLARSIREIRIGLRRAERRIEKDARVRVRALRKDARTQLALLQARQREASSRLGRLAAAAGDSWREVSDAADAALVDARKVAAAVLARFQQALRG
ncbi:MAG TPA: hypothetical protein VKH82_06185 [Candidatus Binatia bacterium]|nr:hypothetical protein [Candidatus Binatia bacterium]